MNLSDAVNDTLLEMCGRVSVLEGAARQNPMCGTDHPTGVRDEAATSIDTGSGRPR